LEALKKSPADANVEESVIGNTCRLFGKLGNSAMMRKLAGKMTTKNSFENLCMRGLAYYRLGQLDKAVELYSEAVYASGTKPDQLAVNCAFALIAAKQGDWKKTADLVKESGINDYPPLILWASISCLLETGTVNMDQIRNGFMQLAKLPGGSEWQTILAAVCCLYYEKFTLKLLNGSSIYCLTISTYEAHSSEFGESAKQSGLSTCRRQRRFQLWRSGERPPS